MRMSVNNMRAIAEYCNNNFFKKVDVKAEVGQAYGGFNIVFKRCDGSGAIVGKLTYYGYVSAREYRADLFEYWARGWAQSNIKEAGGVID